MKYIFLLPAVLLFLFSCKHEQQDDIVRPTVTITSPVNGQQFVTGDTIKITGICRDDNELDEVPVHITDLETRVEFFHNHYGLLHSNTYNVDTYCVVTTTARTKYSVVIEAADMSGNRVEKEVEVKINH